MTIAKIINPVSRILSRLPLTTAATINTIATTDTVGRISTLFATSGLNKNCAMIPRIIGINTTFMTDINMAINETGNHSLASK